MNGNAHIGMKRIVTLHPQNNNNFNSNSCSLIEMSLQFQLLKKWKKNMGKFAKIW